MSTYREHSEMFGKLSPARLFFTCSIPNMVSMAFASLYTVADGVIVGRYVGSEALAAVNLVMPFIMMSFALADLVAVGSSVQIAIRLGQEKQEMACRIFSFSCKLIFAFSILIGGAAWLLAPFLVAILGAEGQVAALAVTYMRVYALFSPAIMIFFAVDNYLRICGKVKYSMGMNIFSSVANIVLDLIFVPVLGMGILGAALASCLCLAAGTVISFLPFIRKKLILFFVPGRLPLRVVLNIIANGSSEFFSNISNSVCMVLFNTVLMRSGGYLAVAAFSIVMYVDSIVKSMLFGMSDSLQPAISYNYGARQKSRVFALEQLAQAVGAALSLAVMAVMFLGGEGLISLFTAGKDAELLPLGVRAMKIFCLSYVFAWCGIISSSFFTALNRPAFSLILASCQTLLFPAAGLLTLPAFLGLDGVWLSPVLAAAGAFLTAGILMVSAVRKVQKEGVGS